MNTPYGFGKEVAYSIDKATERLVEELQKEGFGILTQIDVAATMKIKLNKEIPPYHILGACNPQLAHKVIELEPSIGLLLPCNVIIREDTNKKVYIEFMDPNAVLKLVDNPKVHPIAQEVKIRLERVLGKM